MEAKWNAACPRCLVNTQMESLLMFPFDLETILAVFNLQSFPSFSRTRTMVEDFIEDVQEHLSHQTHLIILFLIVLIQLGVYAIFKVLNIRSFNRLVFIQNKLMKLCKAYEGARKVLSDTQSTPSKTFNAMSESHQEDEYGKLGTVNKNQMRHHIQRHRVIGTLLEDPKRKQKNPSPTTRTTDDECDQSHVSF